MIVIFVVLDWSICGTYVSVDFSVLIVLVSVN